MRLDAHQHFWHYDPVRDAWIDEGMQRIRRDFLPADLHPLLTAEGMDGCIAVQADQSLEQNDFLLGLSRRNPWIRGVVGWVDLCSDQAGEQLDRYGSAPSFVGVRHVVQAEGAGFMDRADFRAGLSLLAARGLTYDLLIYHHQLAEAIRLAAALPEQPIVLDHLAKPVIAGQPDAEWVAQIRALAAFDNVYCKLSGMVTEVPHRAWTPTLLVPYVETVLGAFGTDRVMYGSDWPVCLVAASYSQQLNALRSACAHLSDDERAAVFGGNAVRFYGIS